MRLLIFIISFQLLSGGTFLPEVLKLPLLISHFQEHQAEDASITFFEFLKLHYNDNEHTQNSNHPHEKLPFKHQHDGCTHFRLVSDFNWVNPFYTVDNQLVIATSLLSNPTHRTPFFGRNTEGGIFQPPQG
jgi:hypothetical protein